MDAHSDLSRKHCSPCSKETPPLGEKEIRVNLGKLNGWMYENAEIYKDFSFKNYYETTAFVNAVAWIAHREDHHPDISFGYKQCRVRYKTHAIKGLSENDFISASKVDALMI